MYLICVPPCLVVFFKWVQPSPLVCGWNGNGLQCLQELSVWFWTKQEMQCSATKGSYILLSWAVGWHTLLLSSVWAVIQKLWQAGAVMFLRVQNQWELWASLCKYNNSGLCVPPLPGFWVLLLLLWEPDSHLFPLLQALPETGYNFSCVIVLQPTRFCSNRWEGVGRCGSWPIR